MRAVLWTDFGCIGLDDFIDCIAIYIALGREYRFKRPYPGIYVGEMRVVMMMGMMVLIASLVIGIVLATFSYDYWNHSIARQL